MAKSLTRQQKRKVIRFAKRVGINDIDFEPVLDYTTLRRELLAINRSTGQATQKDVIRLMRGESPSPSSE